MGSYSQVAVTSLAKSASSVNISEEKARSLRLSRERGEVNWNRYIFFVTLKLIVPSGFLYSSLLLSLLADIASRSS